MVTRPPVLRPNQTPELSASARTFLLYQAQIAYAECEKPLGPEGGDSASEVGVASCIFIFFFFNIYFQFFIFSLVCVCCFSYLRQVEETLTWEALRIILSVLRTDTEDPWSQPPAFKVWNIAFFSTPFFVYRLNAV